MTCRALSIGMLTLFLLSPAIGMAQTQITFRIDMQPQMKDSTFIPSDHTVELTGNQLPFSNTRTIELEDTAPTDSIYVTTVSFPSLVNGYLLKYNFLIKTENKEITERRPRLLQLKGQKQQLEVALFNSFSQ